MHMYRCLFTHVHTIEKVIYNNSEIEKESLCSIADKFPNAASQSMGIGDLSIIEAYQQYREQNRKYVDAHIWTLDQHLKSYE